MKEEDCENCKSMEFIFGVDDIVSNKLWIFCGECGKFLFKYTDKKPKYQRSLAEEFEWNVVKHSYECLGKDNCKHFKSNNPDETLHICKVCYYDDLDKPYGNVMVKIPMEKKSQKKQHYICKYKNHTEESDRGRHKLARGDKYLTRIDLEARELKEDELGAYKQSLNLKYKDADDKKYNRIRSKIVNDNLEYYYAYKREPYYDDTTGIDNEGMYLSKRKGKAPEIYTIEYDENYSKIIQRDREGNVIQSFKQIELISSQAISEKKKRGRKPKPDVRDIPYEEWEYWN